MGLSRALHIITSSSGSSWDWGIERADPHLPPWPHSCQELKHPNSGMLSILLHPTSLCRGSSTEAGELIRALQLLALQATEILINVRFFSLPSAWGAGQRSQGDSTSISVTACDQAE